MGLDGVELIIAIERRFRVDIPDADAEHLTTPRKLIDYLASRLKVDSSETLMPCPSQVAFHRVRHAVVEVTGIQRSRVRRSTLINDVIPEGQRRSLWPELQRKVQVDTWPALVRPAWLARILWYSPFIYFFILLAYLNSFLSSGISFFLAIIGCGMMATAQFYATTRFAIHFEPVTFTVGDLSVVVAAQPSMQESSEELAQKWSREEIATITRAIITDQLGIDNFSDDDRFVEELGVS